MKPPVPVLRRGDYEVRSVRLDTAARLVERHHYAQGGSNTAVFTHGLYERGAFWEESVLGVAWWIPPTKAAALATWPNWQAVLSLSRLTIMPGVPQNAASYLLGQSVRAVRQDPRWECLVTYADTWRGHTGQIYRASNWEYCGLTTPEPVWVDCRGRMVARKAGPHTRTKAEMEQLGYRFVGRHAKHKYRLLLVN